jgi:hypothetical protein
VVKILPSVKEIQASPEDIDYVVTLSAEQAVHSSLQTRMLAVCHLEAIDGGCHFVDVFQGEV